jgi:hypothetical protein
MTFKKFVDNIENIYANQGDKPESERLRYGQIIMMELWDIWPQKYHQIAGSDKDPFYFDILHKKPGRDKHPLLAPALYDLLDELEKEWPVFPALSEDKVRIQRLEKKIKKLQNSNKRHRKNLEFYKRIVRDFPWIEPSSQTRKENIELTNELRLKGWTIKGLKHDLEYLDNQITDDMITTIEQSNAGYDPLVDKVIKTIKNIKRGINLYQIKKENNDEN